MIGFRALAAIALSASLSFSARFTAAALTATPTGSVVAASFYSNAGTPTLQTNPAGFVASPVPIGSYAHYGPLLAPAPTSPAYGGGYFAGNDSSRPPS